MGMSIPATFPAELDGVDEDKENEWDKCNTDRTRSPRKRRKRRRHTFAGVAMKEEAVVPPYVFVEQASNEVDKERDMRRIHEDVECGVGARTVMHSQPPRKRRKLNEGSKKKERNGLRRRLSGFFGWL